MSNPFISITEEEITGTSLWITQYISNYFLQNKVESTALWNSSSTNWTLKPSWRRIYCRPVVLDWRIQKTAALVHLKSASIALTALITELSIEMSLLSITFSMFQMIFDYIPKWASSSGASGSVLWVNKPIRCIARVCVDSILHLQ